MHVLDLVWKSVFHLSETKFTCLMKQLDIKGKGVIFVAFIFYIYKTLVKRSEVFVNNISEEFKIYIRFFFFSVQKYGCNIFILSFLVHHVLKKVFSGFVWIFFFTIPVENIFGYPQWLWFFLFKFKWIDACLNQPLL